MASIAFFETKKWEEKHLKKSLRKHTLKFFEGPLDNENISEIKGFDIISVFIYSHVTKNALMKLPKLKMIATRSTGFDHIDIQECKKRQISICTVPSYGENTVAEHTFGLILSLSRNIHKSYIRTLKNDFSIEGLTGFDLKGKILGVVGGGNIGFHVARTARAFGMDVLVYDLHKNTFMEDVLDFKYVTFNELLKNSDIISLHVPHNKHTHHLIDKKNIAKMKEGAILINTSRGQIVDTDALLQALETKHLSGAGLDVIEGEESIKEEHELLHRSKNTQKLGDIITAHKIFDMDNVVFTPHNAFNSSEALMRILDTTSENIDNYFSKKPCNSVN
ncbi:hydroxyacid dehydrogenase [Candidatus Woesearchaeota archaeon]|nr:hydroxyacid dehydrogenase [Candidatus Woesearchaeota archaeon]